MEIRDRRDELLLLVAVSGELPAGWSGYAIGSDSYAAVLVTQLKKEGDLTVRSKDGMKGCLLYTSTDGILDVLFKATSWKNYVLGAGASEDIYTSEIQTGGDTIFYDTVRGCVKEVIYFNQGEEPWASICLLYTSGLP